MVLHFFLAVFSFFLENAAFTFSGLLLVRKLPDRAKKSGMIPKRKIKIVRD